MTSLVYLACLWAVGVLIAPYLRRESRWVRGAIVTAYTLLVARYLLWRFLSLPPLAADPVVLLTYAFFALELTASFLAMDDFRPLRRTIQRSAEAHASDGWFDARPPRVDVLIATYNESWEVLEKTLVGATSLDYPNFHVWILDDGRRAWLEARAAALGVGYVTRASNQHYKAGNLNNGIRALRAQGIALEFLAVLDADFIARPQFLRRTMALMHASDVGIVQTPQCFYNPDPHQQAFGGVANWPDEQRSWFDVYLPSLDAIGCATCCGTSCLVRMAALDAIGGLPTASVCEDTLTSIKMKELGIRTVFLHEALTVGLAPEGIGEYLTQRARWLLGGVQNDKYCGPAPGPWGRIRYWLTLWRTAIWGLMPPLWVLLTVQYWFTGVTLVPVQNLNEAVAYFGPLWLCRFAEGWLCGGRQGPFVSDAVWMLLAPMWIRETYRAVTGSPARFKVTDKAQHRDATLIHWRLLRFHGVLLAGLIGGMIYTLIDPRAFGHGSGFAQVNMLLSAWWILVIVAGIAPMVEAPKRRHAERFATNVLVGVLATGAQQRWRAVDLSIGGIAVETDPRTAPESIDVAIGELAPIAATRVRTVGKDRVAYAFRDQARRADLIREIYCTDRYIRTPTKWSTLVGIGSVLKRVFL